MPDAFTPAVLHTQVHHTETDQQSSVCINWTQDDGAEGTLTIAEHPDGAGERIQIVGDSTLIADRALVAAIVRHTADQLALAMITLAGIADSLTSHK